MTVESLRNRIAAWVAGIWGLVALASIYTRDYTELGIVTPVMMLIGGFLFAVKSAPSENHPPDHIKRENKENVQKPVDDLSDWGGG